MGVVLDWASQILMDGPAQFSDRYAAEQGESVQGAQEMGWLAGFACQPPESTGVVSLSADTQHDDAILTSVGASLRARRTLAAARAGCLTVLGGTLAVRPACCRSGD